MMKKSLVVFAVLCSVVVMCATGSAVDLANTTFEVGSAGPGTWDTSLTNAWNGNPDIASGVPWAADPGATIATTGAYYGDQYGTILQDSSSSKFATLNFGSGGNVGSFGVTVATKFTGTVGFVPSGRYMEFCLGSSTSYQRVSTKANGDGTNKIYAVYNDGTGTKTLTLNAAVAETSWYDLQIIYHIVDEADDSIADTFDVKGRVAGSTTWDAELYGLGALLDVDSFDDLTLRVVNKYLAHDPYTANYDNISVVPEPATIMLLGLGLFGLRRRK